MPYKGIGFSRSIIYSEACTSFTPLHQKSVLSEQVFSEYLGICICTAEADNGTVGHKVFFSLPKEVSKLSGSTVSKN